MCGWRGGGTQQPEYENWATWADAGKKNRRMGAKERSRGSQTFKHVGV